jgi:hypothetical protein
VGGVRGAPTHSRSRPGTGRPPSWRCICPAMRLTQLGSDGAGRYQIMGLVQLCLLKKGTARAGSTMRLLKRRSLAGQFATTLAFPPFNRGTPPCPGGRCKLWDPFHHPTEQAFACRPWRPRMKEYLQCAQRAACRAAPMHAALRAVSGRPGGLTLYSPLVRLTNGRTGLGRHFTSAIRRSGNALSELWKGHARGD